MAVNSQTESKHYVRNLFDSQLLEFKHQSGSTGHVFELLEPVSAEARIQHYVDHKIPLVTANPNPEQLLRDPRLTTFKGTMGKYFSTPWEKPKFDGAWFDFCNSNKSVYKELEAFFGNHETHLAKEGALIAITFGFLWKSDPVADYLPFASKWNVDAVKYITQPDQFNGHREKLVSFFAWMNRNFPKLHLKSKSFVYYMGTSKMYFFTFEVSTTPTAFALPVLEMRDLKRADLCRTYPKYAAHEFLKVIQTNKLWTVNAFVRYFSKHHGMSKGIMYNTPSFTKPLTELLSPIPRGKALVEMFEEMRLTKNLKLDIYREEILQK